MSNKHCSHVIGIDFIMKLLSRLYYAWIFSCLTLTFLNAKQKTNAKTNGKEATLIFAGDITFDGPVKYFADVNRTCGYKRPFSRIRKYLKQGDITIANMESPLFEKAKKLKFGLPNKSIHHNGRTKATQGLLYASIDLVQLANNHMADFGSDAISSTVESLKRAGISFVGLTNSSRTNSSQEPFIKVVNGIKIGFLSYCWDYEGCNMIRCHFSDNCKSEKGFYRLAPAIFRKDRALIEIKGLGKTVDIMVVLMHWGKELTILPSLRLRKVAREISMAGASIIIGTHPHVVQGHECIGTHSLVVYSLGNLLLPKAGSIGVSLQGLLGDRQPSLKQAQEYLKRMKNTFNLSQLAYIFKIKVSRRGITSAQYLPIEIENEERTNCLQPIPKGDWLDFCRSDDLYCYDYRSFYAKSSMEFDEEDYADKIDRDLCVKV